MSSVIDNEVFIFNYLHSKMSWLFWLHHYNWSLLWPWHIEGSSVLAQVYGVG